MVQGHQDGKTLAEEEWTSATRAIIFTDFIAAAFAWKSNTG